MTPSHLGRVRNEGERALSPPPPSLRTCLRAALGPLAALRHQNVLCLPSVPGTASFQQQKQVLMWPLAHRPEGQRAGAWEGCVCPFLAPLSLLAQLGPRRMGCLGRGRSCRSGASRCPTLSHPPEGQLRGPLRCSFGSLQLILMTRGTCPRLCHLSLESCPPRPLGRPPPTDIPLPPGNSPPSFQGGLWPRPPACGFSRALGTRAAVRGVWKPAPEVTQSHPPLPMGHRPPKKAPPFSWSHVGRDRGRLAWGGVGWGGVSIGGRRGVPALPASVLGPQDGSR